MVAWWVRVSGPWALVVGGWFGVGKLVDRPGPDGYNGAIRWVVIAKKAVVLKILAQETRICLVRDSLHRGEGNMPVVQVEAQLPTDALLKAVGQLNQSDLEQFVFQVIALRARRQASSLPRAESELLLKINKGVSLDLQARYNELIAKRQAETLTPDEYEELLGLTQQVERLDVHRLEHLAELARLRGTSLTALMENLGIRPPSYA